MYSRSNIAVDKGIAMEPAEKGLGFDWSPVTDLLKTAIPSGINLLQNQMQLKQIVAMRNAGYNVQYPGAQLPGSQVMGQQPTFGGQQPYYQQSSGIGTGTMLTIGAAAVVGILAFKMLR